MRPRIGRRASAARASTDVGKPVSKFLGALSRLSVLRFAVIGALGMPVDWAVLQLMVHWGTGPYVGRVISWFCAATFTWAGNRYFTFAASRARTMIGTAR